MKVDFEQDNYGGRFPGQVGIMLTLDEYVSIKRALDIATALRPVEVTDKQRAEMELLYVTMTDLRTIQSA